MAVAYKVEQGEGSIEIGQSGKVPSDLVKFVYCSRDRAEIYHVVDSTLLQTRQKNELYWQVEARKDNIARGNAEKLAEYLKVKITELTG
ncbi:hypothetical protein HY450_01700 [Candidatus Pacearchaeota archaeon]|nr:hypothetical protein [Candidatus Pacearchaeota archaeon]